MCQLVIVSCFFLAHALLSFIVCTHLCSCVHSLFSFFIYFYFFIQILLVISLSFVVLLITHSFRHEQAEGIHACELRHHAPPLREALRMAHASPVSLLFYLICVCASASCYVNFHMFLFFPTFISPSSSCFICLFTYLPYFKPTTILLPYLVLPPPFFLATSFYYLFYFVIL